MGQGLAGPEPPASGQVYDLQQPVVGACGRQGDPGSAKGVPGGGSQSL